MNYHVHFYLSPDGYTCEVYALSHGAHSATLARGTGPTKENARDATLAVTTDPEVRRALINCVPAERTAGTARSID